MRNLLPRIGLLFLGSPTGDIAGNGVAFRDGLQALGSVGWMIFARDSVRTALPRGRMSISSIAGPAETAPSCRLSLKSWCG
jgi:hypothetical protein